MSHSIKVIPGRKVVLVSFYGKVSMEELESVRKEILNHKEYHHDFDGVYDFRLDQKDFSPEKMQDLAQTLKLIEPSQGRWCSIVSDPKDTAYSLLLRQEVSAKLKFEVFSTTEAASSYLRMSQSEFLSQLSGIAHSAS